MTSLTILPRPLQFARLAFLMYFTWTESPAQIALTPAVFHTNAQLVLVPVTVTDRNGKSIEGLGAKDFNILEDQVAQQIVSFTTDDAPCSVGLVLDVSGSMVNALSAARGVAGSFLQTANAGDEFLLLSVSTQPGAAPGFTSDIADLQDSIGRIRPGGMTALIDTVYLGLNRMRKANQPRRALLILSDGIDNHSRYSKGELLRVAQEANVQIYTIIFGDNSPGASGGAIPLRPVLIRKAGDHGEENAGVKLLEELSDKTGGLHFRVRSDAEAKAAAIKTGLALRSEYVIGYQPRDFGTTGKWHRIRVKSNLPKANALRAQRLLRALVHRLALGKTPAATVGTETAQSRITAT